MFFFCLIPLPGCQRPLFNVVVQGGRGGVNRGTSGGNTEHAWRKIVTPPPSLPPFANDRDVWGTECVLIWAGSQSKQPEGDKCEAIVRKGKVQIQYMEFGEVGARRDETTANTVEEEWKKRKKKIQGGSRELWECVLWGDEQGFDLHSAARPPV